MTKIDIADNEMNKLIEEGSEDTFTAELLDSAVVVHDDEEKAPGKKALELTEEEIAEGVIIKNGRRYHPHTCKYCGEIFYNIFHDRGICCTSAECKRAYGRDANRKFLKESDGKRKKMDGDMLFSVFNKKKNYNINKKREERIRERNKRIAEKGFDYGDYQAKKLLEEIPKIDLDITHQP